MQLRKVLPLLLLIFLASQAKATTPVLLQSCVGHQDDTGTGSATCSLTLGASHTVFLGFLVFSGTAIWGDSPLGLTYTDVFTQLGHNFGGFPTNLGLECAPTGAGGFTTFFAQNGTINGGEAVIALEYSGIPSCTSDGHNGAFGTTGGSNVTVSSGTAVTTQPDFLISAGFTFNQSPTAGTGYTIIAASTFNNTGSGGGNNTITIETNTFSPAGTRDGQLVIPTAGVWELGFGALGPVSNPTSRNKSKIMRYRKQRKPKIILVANAP